MLTDYTFTGSFEWYARRRREINSRTSYAEEALKFSINCPVIASSKPIYHNGRRQEIFKFFFFFTTTTITATLIGIL